MNISADISVYTDSSQFMFELGDNKQMDILILDIEMPKMSGFEIADYVKKSNPNCLIIFMTSHVNYAVFAYPFVAVKLLHILHICYTASGNINKFI